MPRSKKSKCGIVRFFALLLFFALTLSLCAPVSALPQFPTANEGESVYLWCEQSDEVIYRHKAKEQIYPASTVKIMTGLVAIELIGDRLDEVVSISAEALAMSKGTSIQLKGGESASYRDLLYATVCGGFNDAAYALAEASAGSVAEFVRLMNEKTASLGAHDTHYTNPTGWHDSAMVSTLSDVAIIAKEAMKNELYMTVSSAESYTATGGFKVRNRNGLISPYYAYGYYNRRAKGLIAGMTDEGGYCVATVGEYDSQRFLCIVLGGSDEGGEISSYKSANDLLSYAFNYYGELPLIDGDDVLLRTPVSFSLDESSLSLVAEGDVNAFLLYDKNSLENITYKTYLFSDTLCAPIKKGDVLGGVDVFVDGRLITSARLVAARDVDESPFLVMMEWAKDVILSRGALVFIICFTTMFCIYFYYYELRPLQKRKKKIRFDRIY